MISAGQRRFFDMPGQFIRAWRRLSLRFIGGQCQRCDQGDHNLDLTIENMLACRHADGCMDGVQLATLVAEHLPELLRRKP